jgi:hypothetical protein
MTASMATECFRWTQAARDIAPELRRDSGIGASLRSAHAGSSMGSSPAAVMHFGTQNLKLNLDWKAKTEIDDEANSDCCCGGFLGNRSYGACTTKQDAGRT